MNVAEFIAICPRVYHVASALAWPSIEVHGLLSTARLLDHFDVDLKRRHELLTRPRTESTQLVSPGLSPAVIRDQKPMKFLAEKLEPGSSLGDFLAAINERVFFWANRDRVDRLRNAKEYRAEGQVILHVDTRKLVARYEHQIQLCRFNSGAVTQRNHPIRSRDSWLPISRYPYEQYRRKHGRGNALAEVTVLDSVLDIVDLTVELEQQPAG